MVTQIENLVNISETEKQFPNEWLGFEVLEEDAEGYAVRGRLIAHSVRKEEMMSEMFCLRPKSSYVVWTGERPPKGIYILRLACPSRSKRRFSLSPVMLSKTVIN